MSYPSIKVFCDEREWVQGNEKWVLQEKIDGSQLSFFSEDNVAVEFFNKGKSVKKQNAVFSKAISMIETIADLLNPMYVYHGEAVTSKTHNTAVYERTPHFYFILYDIQDRETKEYFYHEESVSEAERVGLEHVPAIFVNCDESIQPQEKAQEIIELMESGEIQSILGGFCEGLILKHPRFESKTGTITGTKKKIVTERFKERHQTKKPKKQSETPVEFLENLGSSFATEARFFKAYQHMRDQEQLTGNRRNDVQLLLAELDIDLEKESKEMIKNYLWAEFHKVILTKSKEGFSQWYNDYLSNLNE